MLLFWNSIFSKLSMGQSNLKKKNLHGTQVPFKMPLKDNQSVAIGLGQSNLTKKKNAHVHWARVPFKTLL